MKQSKSELTEAYWIVHWLIWYDDKFSCEFRRLDWLFTFLFHMVQCHFSHLEEEIFPSCGTYEIMMWTSCITWFFNKKNCTITIRLYVFVTKQFSTAGLEFCFFLIFILISSTFLQIHYYDCHKAMLYNEKTL